MGRRRDLNISNRQAERGEHLPDGHTTPDRLDPLTRPDPADLLIFETSKDGREKCRRPDSVIIGEYNDIGGCISDTMGHLQAFVGEWNGEDTYT